MATINQRLPIKIARINGRIPSNASAKKINPMPRLESRLSPQVPRNSPKLLFIAYQGPTSSNAIIGTTK